MRAIWSGSVSFGLVNIPIKLYSPAKSRELSFNLLHKKDFSPIRYAKICKSENREVNFEEIVKGYEYQKGEYLVITEDDFAEVNPKKTQTIDIVSFVKEKEIPSELFEKPYYLEPQKAAQKPYTLLRKAMEKTGKVGIGKFILRNKEHLIMLKPEGNALILDQLRFADDVASIAELNIKESRVDEKEITLAAAIIDQLTEEFDAKKFKDTYREELEEIIRQKAEGKIPASKGRVSEPTAIKDLMAVLKESLQKAKQKH